MFKVISKLHVKRIEFSAWHPTFPTVFQLLAHVFSVLKRHERHTIDSAVVLLTLFDRSSPLSRSVDSLYCIFFFPSEAHRYTADSRGGDRVSRSFVQARELPRRPPPPAAISFLTHPGFSTGSKLTITRQLTIPCTRTFVHTPYLPLSFPLYFLSFCTKATRHTVSRLPSSLSLSLSVYRSIDRSSNNRVQCIV